MNLCANCGHPPRDHYADTGHCEAATHTLWGEENCNCPLFEVDTE